MKLTRLDLALKIINTVLLTFIVIITLYPFWDVLVKSFMSDGDIARTTFALFPTNIQLSGYVSVFTNPTYSLVRPFLNTLFYTITDTVYQLSITAVTAYVLTRDRLPGRKFMMAFCVFTMYFGGGLIPYMLVIRDLGLFDSPFVMILPQFISIYNMLVMRAFFKRLPKELEEAARIDGAGNFRIFISISVPLSMPVIATIALFIAVGRWNEWFSALLYLQGSPEWMPLAYSLQRIIELSSGRNAEVGGVGTQTPIGKSVQYAAIIVSIVPILLVYPFFQKYFASGVMIGSLKE